MWPRNLSLYLILHANRAASGNVATSIKNPERGKKHLQLRGAYDSVHKALLHVYFNAPTDKATPGP